VTVAAAASLSGVLFGHISTWWLLVPIIFAGVLYYRRTPEE
jgi:hypothetical protein